MSRLLLYGVVICLFITSQSSCILLRRGRSKVVLKTDSTAVIPTDTTRVDTVVVSDVKQQLIEALAPVWKQEIAFNTFSGKAKMHYEGKDQKPEVTTLFRIKKNEVIWASVTALGGIVQVARVYITPDSLKLINYLNKEVTIMPLAEASKIIPVPADFSTLQNLIIGGPLRTTGNTTDAADLGAIFSLQVEGDNLIQQIDYSKADTTINTLRMRSDNTGGPSGVVSFSDYQLVNGRKFSMNRNINAVNAGEQYHLEINFNKAEFDEPIDFPFSVPKNYKRN